MGKGKFRLAFVTKSFKEEVGCKFKVGKRKKSNLNKSRRGCFFLMHY